MKDLNHGGCRRALSDKECFLTELRLPLEEQIALTLARYFFEAFSEPRSMAWLNAFAEAEARFGFVLGPQVAARMTATLQAVRHARRSDFMYNKASCPGCSTIVTEHERRLMMGIHLMRKGDLGRAQLEVMMLCEGNNVDHVLQAISAFGRSLDETVQPEKIQKGWARLASQVMQ